LGARSLKLSCTRSKIEKKLVWRISHLCVQATYVKSGIAEGIHAHANAHGNGDNGHVASSVCQYDQCNAWSKGAQALKYLPCCGGGHKARLCHLVRQPS
jgi:hypothetical protein